MHLLILQCISSSDIYIAHMEPAERCCCPVATLDCPHRMVPPGFFAEPHDMAIVKGWF